MSDRFLRLPPATSARRDAIPAHELWDLHAAIIERVRAGARIAACFVPPEAQLCAHVVLADPRQRALLVARSRPLSGELPSLARELPALQLFEREIAEQTGLALANHPWPRPVRFAPPLLPSAPGAAPLPAIGEQDFYRIEGDEVHEVGVGPVHAGVIEPGHFRFQCHGERVLHLEIALGYQHRGVERALIGGPDRRTLHLMETLAGDTSIGHTTAYCQVIEALAGCTVPLRAQAIRTVALELERLANHTGDLGALAGDIGFLPTASFCGRLRGDWLNATAMICGNRFGRSLVVPGGVGFAVEQKRAIELLHCIERAMADLLPSVGLLWETPSVMARFEETGKLSLATALELGLVGVAARACGLSFDARIELPTGSFLERTLPLATATTGDVLGRARVRALEIKNSAAHTTLWLDDLPPEQDRAPLGALAADCIAATMVEGWRGEICHVALTGATGRFAAYKVVDPSFHNWIGLALAMREQQISDFPLCNKSFNLSYCGFDL